MTTAKRIWVEPTDGSSAGEAVLVWTEGRMSMAEFEALGADGELTGEEFDSYLVGQDVYMAAWHPDSGWTTPERVSDQNDALFGDAQAKVAPWGDGTEALIAWCRAMDPGEVADPSHGSR